MNKHIYLIRGEKEENYPAFTFRIFEASKSISRKYAPASLKISMTTQAPPAMTVIPFKKKKIAAISISSDSDAAFPELVDNNGFAGAFLVEEAVPVAYERNWENNEETPGIGLLTLFHKKKGIDYHTFIDRWHNSHTPLSLRLHPLWNYNRNVVKGKLTHHESWYDGIVEEHFRNRRDLLNIFRFFGRPNKVIQNMWQVYSDSRSFLDYSKVEPYLVSEYHILG